jgi:hypothetical protein
LFQWFVSINLIGGEKMNIWLRVMNVRSYQGGFWHIAMAGALMLVLIGCARTPKEKGEMIPTPAATYRFEDIPVPRSLEIKKEESFIYESEAMKTGILVYGGKSKVGDLARFFKENMDSHGWRLVSNFERSDALLTFTKPGWGCVITILPTGMERAKVEVRVGPIDFQ